MFMLTRRKSVSYFAMLFNSPIALSSFTIFLIVQIVACSPPIDYFIYTSQLAQDEALTSLPSLKSIYLPQAAGKNSIETNERNKQEAKHLDEIANRVLAIVKNSSHSHDNDMIGLDVTRYAWNLMEKQALLYTKNRVDRVRPFINVLLNESHVSNQCKVAIESWLDKLTNLEHWATLMWNSWGEFPPAGLFEGSFTDLGSYRGCMSVEDNEFIGQAQYCTLDYQPLIPTRPRFHSIFKRILDVDAHSGQLTSGDFNADEEISSSHTAHGFGSARFRSSNNHKQIDREASSFQANKLNKRTINHNGTEDLALPRSQQEAISNLNLTIKTQAIIELARKAQYFYYVKFRLGACLPAKCSSDDVQRLAQVENEDSSSLIGWLMPFSIWTNAKRLFDSDTAGTHADLECIHGLRFFTMMWVIYGHTILYTEYQSFTHFYNVIETQIPSFILLPSLNANFSVDTFFVISGILTTYVTWEYTKGDARKFNKFAFAISRYIRLTPQLAIVILCFFLLPLFGDGPMFKQVTEDKAEVCYKNWGVNLLYLQSYINSEKLCIDPSWWLSIEMTFHLVSMVLIIVMIQNPTRGMILNFGVAAALTLWGASIHYSNGFAIQYLPSIPQRYEVASEQTKMFFHRPYPHAASYFIGIALGYVLANRTVKKLSKSQLYQGWFVCAFGLIFSLWGSYYWNLGAPYTQLQATIYYNLCQILWPTSVAWIILACSLGHGGFVDSILTARCFVPLGRITYMTYLSHSLIIYYHSASMNVPVEPSMLLFVYIFIANSFLSLILGVLLTVIYESPILNLQKRLFTYLTNMMIEKTPSTPDSKASSKFKYSYRNTLKGSTIQEDDFRT